MRRFTLAVAFVMLTATASASECSRALRERWDVAMAEMIGFNRQFVTLRNMGERADLKTLCATAAKVPGFVKVAEAYYPSCDPISGPRDLAEFEHLGELAARLTKLRCGAAPSMKGGRPPRHAAVAHPTHASIR